MGLREAGWDEGTPESPLPNASTDQQGLGRGGRPGGRGRLPPSLPAGGPGRRAGRVHVRGRPGDPGRLPRLPGPALAAPAAPAVNPEAGCPARLRLEWRVPVDGRQQQHPEPGGVWAAPSLPPSWRPQRAIKPQTLLPPNLCLSECVGRWTDGARVTGCPPGCSWTPQSQRGENPWRLGGLPYGRIFSQNTGGGQGIRESEVPSPSSSEFTV